MVGPNDKSGCRHGVSFTGHRHAYPGIVSPSQFKVVVGQYRLWPTSPSPPEEGEAPSCIYRPWVKPKISSSNALDTC